MQTGSRITTAWRRGAALMLALGAATLPVAAWAGEHDHREGGHGGGRPAQAPAAPRGGGNGGGNRGGGQHWGGGAPQQSMRQAPPAARGWSAPRAAAPQAINRGGFGGGWNGSRPVAPPAQGYAGGYRGSYVTRQPGGNAQQGWAARDQRGGWQDRRGDGRAAYAGREDRREGNWGYAERRGPGGGWDGGWRSDRRYDWAGWRSYHRELFHPGWYYPPYGGYAYARLGIGAVLAAAWFEDRYWIDPDYYHLPPVWGPYRWVRYYNDCLLIDIDTGEVVDVVSNVFW